MDLFQEKETKLNEWDTRHLSPLCELTVHNGSNIYLSHHQKCLEFDLKYT